VDAVTSSRTRHAELLFGALSLVACGDDAPSAPTYGPYVQKCTPGTVPARMAFSSVQAVGADGQLVAQLTTPSARCTTQSADGLLYRCEGPYPGPTAGEPPRWRLGILLAFRRRPVGQTNGALPLSVLEHGRDFDVRELSLATLPGLTPAQRYDATTPVGGLDLTIRVGRQPVGLNRDGRPYTQPAMLLVGSACGGTVSGTFNLGLELDETLPP